MVEETGAWLKASPAVKRNDVALSVARGAGATVVESLRRRHVQAELQLREMEDRFRRDCSRQEQELELLRIENNKYKAKIEEMRMTQTAPREVEHDTYTHGGESKLLKASSRKYCMARETVERAREELNEIKARVVSARQRIHELRVNSGGRRTRTDSSKKSVRSSCTELVTETRASRTQLRGLEAHVEFETGRFSDITDAVKELRAEIDVLLTAQRSSDDIFYDREQEMTEIMKETSFLIEVCNILFDERDVIQEKLAELHRSTEADNEAYESAFCDLVKVEERDKAVKAKLRENISKLEDELQNVVTERETAERLVGEEEAAFRLAKKGNSDDDNDSDQEDSGLSQQVAEFERYIGRLADIAGTGNLAEIERYVCEGGDGRFKLYTVLHRTQDSVAALEQEKEALQAARLHADNSSDSEQRAREEMVNLQEKLDNIKRETLEQEQRSEHVKSQLDAALPDVQSIFDALGCDDSLIVAQHGATVLSRGTLNAFLAVIEQRVEEYMAVWMRQKQPAQAVPPTLAFNHPGLKLTSALTDTAKKTSVATLPHVLPSTQDAEVLGLERSMSPDQSRSETAIASGRTLNESVDTSSARRKRGSKVSPRR